MAAPQTIEVLSRSPLFEMLSDIELQYVAGLAEVRKLRAQEILFQEGASGDGVYVIMSGEVELLKRGGQGLEEPIAKLVPPQLFGEMSLIDIEYRSATARARTDAELLHLTAEALTTFRKAHPDGFTLLALNIAKVLSARLRDALAQLAARSTS